MNSFRTLCIVALLASNTACDSSDDSTKRSSNDSTPDASDDASPDASDASEVDASPDEKPLTASTVLDLSDVKQNPTDYEFGDFKPNVQKLILAGAADTEHVAILWYTVKDGGVGLHYHAKTESVYVIDGTQTDAKGVYPTGSVYFNPPGSGHQITDSSGFFLLAYAAPPDFADTDLIGEYTPIRIDTDGDDLTSEYPFEEAKKGVRTFAPALDSAGGMTAELFEITSAKAYDYTGNYVLVVKGSCGIDGVTLGEDMVVVSKTIEPQPYKVTASKNSSCLAMGVSF
jgi:ChrR Cupin-like domain